MHYSNEVAGVLGIGAQHVSPVMSHIIICAGRQQDGKRGWVKACTWGEREEVEP